MVLGLKLMGKLATPRKIQVLSRTKVLYGPRTQTYGETSYFKIRKIYGYGLSARLIPRIIGSTPAP